MRTKTVNVYKYEELSETAKDKVKQWLNEDIEDLTATLISDLYEHFCFPHAKLSYSLNSCQGDGVSFTGTWVGEELKAIFDKAYDNNVPSEVTKIIPYLALNIIRIDNRYSHEGTVITELSHDWYDEEHIAIIEQVEEVIDSYRHDICKNLEDIGYTEIDDRNSDDFMELQCEANDYEFYENGELA